MRRFWRISKGAYQIGRYTVYVNRRGLAVFDDNGDFRWGRVDRSA